MNHVFDINLGIWMVFGVLLLVCIVYTLINHRNKIKSNMKTCISCRGVGFTMTLYRDRPNPSCRKCNGTGYVKRSKE